MKDFRIRLSLYSFFVCFMKHERIIFSYQPTVRLKPNKAMHLLHRRSQLVYQVLATPTFASQRRIMRVEKQQLLSPIRKKNDKSYPEVDSDWENEDDIPQVSRKVLVLGKPFCRVQTLLIVLFTCALSFLFLTYADRKNSKFNGQKLPGGYRSKEEMLKRDSRFPTVEDRVKLYMSSWYTQPCNFYNQTKKISVPFNEQSTTITLAQFNFLRDDSNDSPLLMLQEAVLDVVLDEVISDLPNSRLFLVDSDAEAKGSRIFFMDPTMIRKCDHSFCTDTKEFLFPSLARVQERMDGSWNVPILMQFGDAEISRAFRLATKKNESYPNIPIIKKFRYSLEKDELRRLTSRVCYDALGQKMRDVPMTRKQESRLQPIISKLTFKRHFGMLDEIPQFDIPWSQKKNAAIWRGALTGQKRDGFSLRDEASMTSKDMCLLMHRCRLVYQNANSKLVDANLVGLPGRNDIIPGSIDGINIYGEKASYAEMLQYKAIIMLEGNDVSSGLKWALYSNSVLMTQRSTYTSWAMEELLEAWVHYVPLNEDLSDVEEKMQWILDNDEEAANIAHRGTLWISDLIYHPDAQYDDELIFDETFQRYKSHFIMNKHLVP